MRPVVVDFLDHVFGTRIFGALVPSETFMIALGVGVMQLLFVRDAASHGIPPRRAAALASIVVVLGLIGSRVLYVLQNWRPEYSLAPITILSIHEGTASWGGYLGAILGLVVGCGILRLPLLTCADSAARFAGVGIALGRVGCFLDGDDFGRVARLPWAVRFPHGSYPFLWQVHAGLLSPGAGASLPVHPVQLYFAITGLVLFLVLNRFARTLARHPGATFCLGISVYCICRYALEYLRADQVRTLGALTFPQIYALITIGPALLCLYALLRGPRAEARS